MPDRKRRVAPGASLETPQRKRARKRVSGEYKKPHTDEELARRFKAVSESHLRFELKIDANCIARIMKSMSAVGQKGLSSKGLGDMSNVPQTYNPSVGRYGSR